MGIPIVDVLDPTNDERGGPTSIYPWPQARPPIPVDCPEPTNSRGRHPFGGEIGHTVQVHSLKRVWRKGNWWWSWWKAMGSQPRKVERPWPEATTVVADEAKGNGH